MPRETTEVRRLPALQFATVHGLLHLILRLAQRKLSLKTKIGHVAN